MMLTQMELQKKLGECIEHLSNREMDSEELQREIERSKTIACLAKQAIRNTNEIINSKKYVGALNKQLVDELIG